MQEDLFTIMQKTSQKLQDEFIFNMKGYGALGLKYLEVVL